MATIAKHILIAREQGEEAGMEAYLNDRMAQRYETCQRILRKRTFESQLAEYRKAFGEQIGNAAVESNPVIQERRVTDVQALVEAAVQAALAGAGVVDAPAKRGPDRPKGSKNKPKVDVTRTPRVALTNGTISAGDAWEALGAQDEFKPKDLNKPANNGQLWRLNSQGLLALRS